MRTTPPKLRFKLLAAGLIALAVPSIAALAQDPPAQGKATRQGKAVPPKTAPGGMMGGMMAGMGGFAPPLILAEPVQEDLALTDKQKAAIKKAQNSNMQKVRDLMQSAREEGNVDPQEIGSAMNGIKREFDSAVNKALDKKQKDRLAQIELQRDGLMAVSRSEVASKIKLSSAQTKKIRAIVDEMRRSSFPGMPMPPNGGAAGKVEGNGDEPFTAPGGGEGQFPPGFPGGGLMPPGLGGNNLPGGNPNGGAPGAAPPAFDPEVMREAFAKMQANAEKARADAIKKIGEVLTKDQTDAFEKLQGKPFDLSQLGPPKPPEGAAEGAEATKADEKAMPTPKKGDRTKAKKSRDN